jgi:hypothetical protein
MQNESIWLAQITYCALQYKKIKNNSKVLEVGQNNNLVSSVKFRQIT